MEVAHLRPIVAFLKQHFQTTDAFVYQDTIYFLNIAQNTLIEFDKYGNLDDALMERLSSFYKMERFIAPEIEVLTTLEARNNRLNVAQRVQQIKLNDAFHLYRKISFKIQQRKNMFYGCQ